MKIRLLLATLLGAALGAGATFLVMRDAPIENDDDFSYDPFSDPVRHEEDPFANYKDRDVLSIFSGNWVSVDGQLSAELDYRILRFGETPGWPDLDQRYFLLGQSKMFMTNSGTYNLSCIIDEPDKMCVIKEELGTGEHTFFNLYRETSPHARSREPLGDKTPPPKVQALLDAMPTITAGETKDSVMHRLGLADDDSLEVLAGMMEHGDSDVIFSLGIDNEWMLRLEFSIESPDQNPSEALIRRFQIVRGYVDDVREGRIDLEKRVFPYFRGGIVTTDPNVIDSGKPDEQK